MWRTPDGCFHTVAVPSPVVVLGERLMAHVSRVLNLYGLEALDDAVEQACNRFYDDAPETWHQPDEDNFAGAVPDWSPEAVTLADEPQRLVDALTTAAGYRWTLDVLHAVENAADQTDRE